MSEHKNTTATGNAFRDSVCDLLRTRYPGLSIEKRAAGTKIDIRFVQEEFGRTQTWAVECKDYTSPLTKSYVTKEISPQYRAMQDSREVDRILIVTRKGVSTDAQEFINGWTGASHQTYEQLAETLVGLRSYIQHLAGLKPTDNHDYVEARLDDMPGSALEAIQAWIADDGAGPSRAILGGYGQGKSALARHLAAYQAGRYLADPTLRMPILLRLGEVVHETQLEALFGKEFTARYPSPGYQFATLEHLGRSGRLLIILDGFDEMKHAMTAADFQSNFVQFNRLLVGKAKVLLLGRPNALPSEERKLVFRGTTQVAGQQVASMTFARWPEWKMSFFDSRETSHLLSSCLSVFQQQHAHEGRFTYPSDFVTARMREIATKIPADLLRRPVHVQLVAGLAADPGFDLTGFNEYRLYEHFIREMVERDTRDKPARRLIALEPRLKFQRELAWWAWRRPEGQGYFSRNEVPAAILQDLPNGNAVDDDGKRNEYIVSTLTEEKESGVLFFAHRSFQEFLVAERMRLVAPTPAAHSEYSNFLTDEVEGFLRQSPDPGFIVEWYKTLQAASGPIALPYLPFFASFPKTVECITETRLEERIGEIDPWTLIILHHAGKLRTAHALDEDKLRALLLKIVPAGRPETAAVAVLSLLERASQDMSLDRQLTSATVAKIIERTLRSARGDTNNGNLTIDKVHADFASTWIQTISKRHWDAGQELRELELSLNLSELERLCCRELQGKAGKTIGHEASINPIRLRDEPSFRSKWDKVTVPASQIYKSITQEVAKPHSTFLRGRRPFAVVPVDRRGRAA